uniref:Uncharacterized protein n=1 Tax=Caenorhabditis tropicalis TaxID=1561998 RepID=A0A1I7SZX4_9PELO
MNVCLEKFILNFFRTRLFCQLDPQSQLKSALEQCPTSEEKERSKAKKQELKNKMKELEEGKSESNDKMLRIKIQDLENARQEDLSALKAKNETIQALEAISEVQRAQLNEAMVTIKSQSEKFNATKIQLEEKEAKIRALEAQILEQNLLSQKKEENQAAINRGHLENLALLQEIVDDLEGYNNQTANQREAEEEEEEAKRSKV